MLWAALILLVYLGFQYASVALHEKRVISTQSLKVLSRTHLKVFGGLLLLYTGASIL
jgi:hypothetical protein